MSAEHIVSNAIFAGGCGCPPLLSGVPRVRNGSPTPNAGTANILCRRHNSGLSILDELAGRVSSFLSQAARAGTPEPLYIEGERFERWLLKTAVNMAAAGWMGPKWLPGPELVSAIFGLEPVPEGYGLYLVNGRDPMMGPGAGVAGVPIFLEGQESRLGGVYVSVHGMQLFASFSPGLTDEIELFHEAYNLPEFSPSGLRHIYRPGAIVTERPAGDGAIIGLSWGGYFRFSDGTSASLETVLRKPA